MALYQATLDTGLSRETFEDDVRTAMLRHPAEPYLPFLGGLHAARTNSGGVIPWIERSLVRAPVNAPAHYLLATALARYSPGQARLEFRIAAEQAPGIGARAILASLPLVNRYDDAFEVAGISEDHAERRLEPLVSSLRSRLPGTACRLDELDPNTPESGRRRVVYLLADLQAGLAAPWCSGTGRDSCLRAAVSEASRLVQLNPSECVPRELRAEARIQAGKAVQAIRDLLSETEHVSDRLMCLRAVVSLGSQYNDEDSVRRALDEIARAPCTQTTDCLQNLRYAANVELGRGNPRRAFAFLERAHERAPDDEQLLSDVAQLASKVELHAEALNAYQELARLHPGDPKWREAVSAERVAAAHSALAAPPPD